MLYPKSLSAVQILLLAQNVASHGIVRQAVVGSEVYNGYDVIYSYNPQSAPKYIGWSTGDADRDLGYVSDPTNADIICHKQATSGPAHGTIAAGDKITFLWKTGDGGPYVHPGPMLTYMANCNGPCETVDKSTLKFFKIDQAGLQIPAATWQASIWASNQMAKSNNSWTSVIPSDIAPGNYVIRHETIALHSAGQVGGVQFYPQCLNFMVTGSGTATPPGVSGTSLYTATDPGILINIYYPVPQTYQIPGPPLYGPGGGSAGDSAGGDAAENSTQAAAGAAPTGQNTPPPLYALPSNTSMTTSQPAPAYDSAPNTLTQNASPSNSVGIKPLNFLAENPQPDGGCPAPVTVTVTPTPVTVTVTAACASDTEAVAAAAAATGGSGGPSYQGSGNQPAMSSSSAAGIQPAMPSGSPGGGPGPEQAAAVIPTVPTPSTNTTSDEAENKTVYVYNPVKLNSSSPTNLTNVAINTTALPQNITNSLPDLPAKLNITSDAPPLPANASWKDFWAWLMQVVENEWFKGGSQPPPQVRKRHSRMFKHGGGHHF